jgi:hypothetical protein
MGKDQIRTIYGFDSDSFGGIGALMKVMIGVDRNVMEIRSSDKRMTARD